MASMEELADAKRPVAPAQLTGTTLYHDQGYKINELTYLVPIDHRGRENEEKIRITVRVVLGKGNTDTGAKDADARQKKSGVLVDANTPIAVYLVGGPGSDNPPTAHSALNDFYLEKGFQVLYMDYRGTGSSHALRADDLNPALAARGRQHDNYESDGALPRLAGLCPQEQADMLAMFRQDNIVRDLEAVRQSLSLMLCSGTPAIKFKWTLVGQSYGGWVAFSYLSFYPASVSMVLLTGGIPPVGQSAATVYKHTYRTVIKACDAFYDKYPHHEASVRTIVDFIARKNETGQAMALPGGGQLTPERFLCLGRTLGTTGGDAKVDKALNKCLADIANHDTFSETTLADIEGSLRFEERPLYAVLQEPIYTEPGLPAAQWSAEAVGKQLPEYAWLKDQDLLNGRKTRRIYFSAEHVYAFHFDQFQALRPLKAAARLLAAKQDWPPLFDRHQLARNTVPIASLSYTRDMFVDWTLGQQTIRSTGAMVAATSAELMHTAVKDAPDQVLPWLWRLLGDAVAKAAGRETLTPAERERATSLLALLSVSP